MESISQLTMNWKSTLLAMLMFPIVTASLFLYYRSQQKKIVIWLLALALAGCFNLIPYLIGFAGAYDLWPGLTFLPVTFTLFFGPFLYIYTYRLTIGGKLGWHKYLLLPGVIYWFYELWAFLFLGDYQAKWAYTKAIHSPYIAPFELSLSLILMVWAIYQSWQLYRRYSAWLKTVRSDSFDLDPVWLKRFIIFISVIGVVWLFETAFTQIFDFNYHQRFIFIFIVLAIIFFMLIEALTCSHVFYPAISEYEAEGVKEKNNTDSKPELDAQKDWYQAALKLKHETQEKAWYLEPRLSVTDLAKRFGTNRSYLSKTINQGLEQSFSEFINALRVEHAKEQLQKESSTIIDVALNSGFGSKASFNRVFKTLTGQTPSQFIRETRLKS